MRSVVNRLVEDHAGICGVFVAEGKATEHKTPESGYRFIIGSKHIDCRQIASLLKEKLGARGGGSQAMIQGSLQGEKEQISGILEDVL
jgi:alanyl-tRNA synthetase